METQTDNKFLDWANQLALLAYRKEYFLKAEHDDIIELLYVQNLTPVQALDWIVKHSD